MLEKKELKENLEKSFCYKCGNNLAEAKIEKISEAPVLFVAHAVCNKCRAQSMVTISSSGTGTVPLISDMSSEEIKKVISLKSITYDEIIDLHVALTSTSIWKLLQKKEPTSGKKVKK